jgi:hypothetical protein
MSDQIGVQILLPGGGVDQIDELASGLAADLRELHIPAEYRSGGKIPEGARAIELVAAGEIMVSLVAGGRAVAGLAGAVIAWWRRQPRGTRVIIEFGGDRLELHHAAAEEQKEIGRVAAAAPDR